MTIDLASGKQLTIIGKNAENSAPYIHNMSLNGNNTEKTWLTMTELTVNDRNELSFIMSQFPDKNWAKNYAPPSYDIK